MVTIEKLLAVAKKSRGKIRHKRHWTQGALARDKFKRSVDPKSKDAVCWCAMGSVKAVTSNKKVIGMIDRLLRDIVEADSGYMGTDAESAEFPSLTAFNYFNDKYGTHEDIIGVFDKLIENLEQERR